MGKVSTLLSLGVRFGAVGGTVYALNQVGAFGDVKQGEAAYNRMKSLTLEEVVGKEVADQVPALEMPQEITSTLSTVRNTTSDVAKNFPGYWNSGVETTFTTAADLPDTSKQYLYLAVEEVKKTMN
jgi:hypothetical protein